MSGSLALLWGLIHSLQIVAYFPLLVVNYPENAKLYSEILLELARFDIIPFDLLVGPTQELLGMESDKGKVEVIEKNLSQQAQEEGGYESASLLENNEGQIYTIMLLVFILITF